MTFPTGPAVQLGTGDRGFALLKEVGEDRNILRIKCAQCRVTSYIVTYFFALIIPARVCENRVQTSLRSYRQVQARTKTHSVMFRIKSKYRSRRLHFEYRSKTLFK